MDNDTVQTQTGQGLDMSELMSTIERLRRFTITRTSAYTVCIVLSDGNEISFDAPEAMVDWIQYTIQKVPLLMRRIEALEDNNPAKLHAEIDKLANELARTKWQLAEMTLKQSSTP